MKTRLKLKPGQKGAKALVEKYGDDFICVRYRYDEATRTRIKTVELIVERKVLPPSPRKIHDDDVVPVRIAYGETELGKMACSAGGQWDTVVNCGTSASAISKERNWKSIYYWMPPKNGREGTVI